MSREIEFIVKGLGSIEPYGDTNVDNERIENIDKYGGLCETLINELIQTASYADRGEYSMQRMGKEAKKWLEDIREMLE